MRVFFAISCVFAILAFSNGWSIIPTLEVKGSRAGVEAQDVFVSTSKIRQGTKATEKSRAVDKVRINEDVGVGASGSDGVAVELKSAAVESQPAADVSTSGNEEIAVALARAKRTLHHLRERCRHGHHSHHRHHRHHHGVQAAGCAGSGCNTGCSGVGCGADCGGAVPCAPQPIVVPQDVPVPQPYPVHVPVVEVVHQDVPIPHPVAVPVTKIVEVPVPVVEMS